jgi:hypothetical protein
MLACFSLRLRHGQARDAEDESADDEAIGYVERYCARPPLEILADELLQTNAANALCRKIFWAYDQFLGLLDDSKSRGELKNTSRDLADRSAVFQLVREISQEFQHAMLEWFFTPGNVFHEVIKEYAEGSVE